MKRLRVAGALLLSAAALAPAVRADDVFLVGGGRIVGEVVERSAHAIVVEVGPGRVTLPASRVARVASGSSALSVYRARAARLGPRDADGWLALAQWARDNDLQTLAGEAFARVLAIEPANESAHRALGHVRLGGQWMSEAESYRARGYVNFQGSWMTPEEARMIAAAEMAEAESRHAEREAAAREREAEARTAEAEAARAAAEAEAAANAGGIPYGWVFGPGYPPYVTHGGARGDRDRSHAGRGRGGRVHRERDVEATRPKPPQRDRGADRATPRERSGAVGRVRG